MNEPFVPPPAIDDQGSAPPANTQNTNTAAQGNKEIAPWAMQFPEENREFLRGHTKPGDFMKVVMDLKTKAEKGIILPDELTPEAVAPLYEKLGRPKTSKDYKVERDPAVPFDEKYVQGVLEHAHANNWTQAQMDAFWKKETDRSKSYLNERKSTQEKREAENTLAINTMWGEKTAENIERCMQAAAQLGGTTLPAKFKAAGLEKDPEVLSLLLKMHEMTSTPNPVFGTRARTEADDRYPNTKL